MDLIISKAALIAAVSDTCDSTTSELYFRGICA